MSPNMAIHLRPEEVALPPSPNPTNGAFTDTSDLRSSPILLPVRSDSLRRIPSPDSTPPNESFPQLPYRSRNHSPLSRGHLRSHSSSPSLSAPPMTRAHSSPSPDTYTRPLVTLKTTRPASPANSQGRRRSPLRTSLEEPYPGIPTWSGISLEPEIPEHAELDIPATNRGPITEYDFGRSSSPVHHTFPRIRRRPSSPLYQSGSAQNAFANPPTISPTPRSSNSSPILTAQRYMNESYPAYSIGSASSMPSTPTSLRSRSPSISSLETIPDTPDAEEQAQLEVEELMRMKTKSSDGDDDSSQEDGPGLRRRSSLESRGYGFGKEKRKRWSVCGAERRQDLDVIYED